MISDSWRFTARVALDDHDMKPRIDVRWKWDFESLPAKQSVWQRRENGVGVGIKIWTKTIEGIDYQWAEMPWHRPPKQWQAKQEPVIVTDYQEGRGKTNDTHPDGDE